jgi:protein-tyrosine phosphatase
MRLAPAYRVCVICSGNICRSPMAEVILRSMLLPAGLDGRVVVDSAGTGGWHEGDPADPRALRALKDHGYDGTHHRAREFRPEWFSDRGLIVAADEGHVRDLRRLAPDAQASARVRLLREFDPTAVESGTLEVDDPYYGDAGDFDRCLTEVERACQGLVGHLRAELSESALTAESAQPPESAESAQPADLAQPAKPAEPTDSRR